MIRRRRRPRTESEKAVGGGGGEHEKQDKTVVMVGQVEDEEAEKKKVPASSQHWIIHQDALTPRSVRRPRTRFDEEEVSPLSSLFSCHLHFDGRKNVLINKWGHQCTHRCARWRENSKKSTFRIGLQCWRFPKSWATLSKSFACGFRFVVVANYPSRPVLSLFSITFC